MNASVKVENRQEKDALEAAMGDPTFRRAAMVFGVNLKMLGKSERSRTTSLHLATAVITEPSSFDDPKAESESAQSGS